MALIFIPIKANRTAMQKYLHHPFCIEVFQAMEGFYLKVGFRTPWIGYFMLQANEVVGTGGFKGPPKDGKVEIAYGTLPEWEGKGIASKICAELTAIALNERADIRITARTLREENASTRILKKNGYNFVGEVMDPDDGLVWEWEFNRSDKKHK